MTTVNAVLREKSNLIARYPLLSFFGLAILMGWLAIIPSRVWGLPFKPFQTIGAYSPFLSAVIVAAAEGGGALKLLLRRITNFRFGIGWYLFSFLFYVVLYLVVATASGAPLGAALAANGPLLITAYLPAMFSIYLVNAFGEESGWTGFGQYRLQQKFRPVIAAILLGLFWAAWHLPAYFVPSEMGAFNPVGFVFFSLSVIFTRTIWVWAANHARASGVFATLLHASSNAVSLALIPKLFPTPTPEQLATSGLILLGLLLVMAVGLVVATRGRLGHQPQPS